MVPIITIYTLAILMVMTRQLNPLVVTSFMHRKVSEFPVTKTARNPPDLARFVTLNYNVNRRVRLLCSQCSRGLEGRNTSFRSLAL